MIPDNTQERTELMVLFRIISRHDWDQLQSWRRACSGSAVEHVMKGTGLFVLTVPRGGVLEASA